MKDHVSSRSGTVRFRIKRIYDKADAGDGYQVLVDRLWPRGLKKEAVELDLWAKELAPSTELRQWIHSQPEKWSDFEQRYRNELRENEYVTHFIHHVEQQELVTFLYAARDEKKNHASILQRFLESTVADD